jgi:hypothetical protein
VEVHLPLEGRALRELAALTEQHAAIAAICSETRRFFLTQLLCNFLRSAGIHRCVSHPL